jgi:hypothetical protein
MHVSISLKLQLDRVMAMPNFLFLVVNLYLVDARNMET